MVVQFFFYSGKHKILVHHCQVSFFAVFKFCYFLPNSRGYQEKRGIYAALIRVHIFASIPHINGFYKAHTQDENDLNRTIFCSDKKETPLNQRSFTWFVVPS